MYITPKMQATQHTPPPLKDNNNNKSTTTSKTIPPPPPTSPPPHHHSLTCIRPLSPLANPNHNKTISIIHHQQQHLTNAPEIQADHYLTLTLHKYDTAANASFYKGVLIIT